MAFAIYNNNLYFLSVHISFLVFDFYAVLRELCV